MLFPGAGAPSGIHNQERNGTMENVAIFPNIERAKYVAPAKAERSTEDMLLTAARRAIYVERSKMVDKLQKENVKIIRQLEKLRRKLDANSDKIDAIMADSSDLLSRF